MTTGARIEICGGIATGKTTLARLLCEDAAGVPVLEDFRANPFWQRFYGNPALYAGEKNICFIAQHCGEIKPSLHETLTICDYAVVQDLAYASLKGDRDHLNVMTALFQHLYRPLPDPVLLIHLEADPNVQLARIRARGRREEDPITTTYLAALNQALAEVLKSMPPACPVRVIKSDAIDFACNRDLALALRRELLAAV